MMHRAMVFRPTFCDTRFASPWFSLTILAVHSSLAQIFFWYQPITMPDRNKKLFFATRWQGIVFLFIIAMILYRLSTVRKVPGLSPLPKRTCVRIIRTVVAVRMLFCDGAQFVSLPRRRFAWCQRGAISVLSSTRVGTGGVIILQGYSTTRGQRGTRSIP